MSQAPKTERIAGLAPAVAAGADGSHALFRAPYNGKIVSASFVADAVLTGANTNTRKIALVNKGQAGSGTTEVAAKQFNSGVNAAAFDETALTLSATAADLNVVEGDILAVVSTHVGTGLADPGGIVDVKFARTPTAE
jgi:hypothetical protein